MIKPCHLNRIMIEDLPGVNETMIATDVISASKSRLIDNTIEMTKPIVKPLNFDECMIAKNYYDNVNVILSSILDIYDPVQLHDKLLEHCTAGVFATSIG